MAVALREKRYGGTRPHVALGALRLHLGAGEFVALVGPSGCGKTTLLNAIAGLDTDYDGEIRSTAARLGMVFQTPRLLPWRTVAQNVALALAPATPGLAERVGAAVAAVGLDGFRDAYPGQLSLGMQRRVAIARAFVIEPDLLLMDEPFVSLDEPTARHLRALLQALLRAHPATVLFVTHDLREAIALADRLVLLSPPPARVVAEVAVPLAPAARDDAAVEDFRRRLLARPEPAFRALV